MQQQGNALFLILIAVALFAALSYAVTSSGRGGGKGITEENMRLSAAAISQYVALVRNEAQRLMLVGGCTVENLDWRNNHWKRLDGAPSVGILHAPVTPRAGCAIFSDYGGSVPSNVDFVSAANAAYNAAVPAYKVVGGHATTGWVNRQGEGTQANDIAFIVHGVDHAVCAYLLDPVTKPAGVIESFAFQPDPNVADTFSWTGTNDVIDEPANVAGAYFAQFNALATGPGCDIGAIVVTR